MTGLAQRLAAVRERIARSALMVGRDPGAIDLLPVTKTRGVEEVEAMLHLGLRRFGENRVQELRAKSEALSGRALEWVQIGHLQTNKTTEVARLASEFHALDSLRVAAALEKELTRIGRRLPVYIQVNTSGEASKFGISPGEAIRFAGELRAFPTLKPIGFMTLALHTTNREAIRSCFATLRSIRDQACWLVDSGLHRLSMGMSADFEIAVEEGSTCVRIGQALFGARETPDSVFWPDCNRNNSLKEEVP